MNLTKTHYQNLITSILVFSKDEYPKINKICNNFELIKSIQTSLAAPCGPGLASKNGVDPCFPCPLGSYQPIPAMNFCHKCPPSETTDEISSTSVEDCKDAIKMKKNNRNDFKVFTENGKTEKVNYNLKDTTNDGFIAKFMSYFINNINSLFELFKTVENKKVWKNSFEKKENDISRVTMNDTGNKGNMRISDIEKDSTRKHLKKIDKIKYFYSKESFSKSVYNSTNYPTFPPNNSTTHVAIHDTFDLQTYTYQTKLIHNRAFNAQENDILEASECFRSPCLNGGSCVAKHIGYTCLCAAGWTGL